jgi:hypothetical protein
MAQINKTPFNIDLLILDKNKAKQLKPITKLNIFETSSQNFDPDGLYSTKIFGPVGSELRNDSFAYIDLKIKILHPLVYQHYCTMKALYKDVMHGKKYAKYSKADKDLVPATIEDGDTGYTFFINNMENIKFDPKDSDQRDFKIKIKNKYGKKEDMFSNWLVLPAGMRDYTVDEAGKPSTDEVNDIYKKLIAVTTILNNTKVTPSTEYTIDNIKVKIQNITLELYEHFRTLLDGKNKFIQGKWSKRAISQGTRNVITPPMNNITDLDSNENITLEHSVVGLYQYIRGIAPITMNRLHTLFINRIFNPSTTLANLVDPKTMETVVKEVPVKKRDEWLSLEGLDDIIGKLEQEDIRTEPIKVDGFYMLLVHEKGDDITVVFNTANLPEEYDRKYLRPITYFEMMYLAIYDVRNKYPGFLTRYPVTNLGSIFPSKLYVKTTSKGRTINLTMNGQTKRVTEYPDFKESFYNSMSIPYSYLGVVGGDFDGDTMSLNILYTDESIKEINDILNNKDYYIKPDGSLAFSPVTDTLQYVIKTMSDKNNTLFN